MMNGIIVINKEKGMTSHDVVGRVRHILGEKRVGHTGTLDPEAEGVLPVCIGRAARIAEYLDTDMKRYSATMALGRKTETYDLSGEVEAVAPEYAVNLVSKVHVEKILEKFSGHITQKPPIYSAVKVSGKRLYEYARKGREVEIPERDVYVEEIKLTDAVLRKGYASTLSFDVTCTKGTFIRSICNDIGEELGIHGALASLTRTGSGVFTLDDAVTLDELEAGDPLEHLLPADHALDKFGEVTVEEKDAFRLINGLEIEPKVYKIESEPYYLEHEFYFPVREDYKYFYKVYGNISKDSEIPGRPEGTTVSESGRVFIGIGKLDPKNRHLIPEKIFI